MLAAEAGRGVLGQGRHVCRGVAPGAGSGQGGGSQERFLTWRPVSYPAHAGARSLLSGFHSLISAMCEIKRKLNGGHVDVPLRNQSFLHSLNQHFLSTCCEPSPMLVTGATAVNNRVLAFWSFPSHRETESKGMSKRLYRKGPQREGKQEN